MDWGEIVVDLRQALRPGIVKEEHLMFLDEWWLHGAEEHKGRSTARRALEAEFPSLSTPEAKAVLEYWQVTAGASWR